MRLDEQSFAKTAGRILVVDDDQPVGSSIAGYLGRRYSEVTVTQSPEEALVMIRRAEFDIVITDIQMPGLDGISLLAAIKDLAPGTEVVIMTGHGELDSAIAALRAGAADYLRKPVDLVDLRIAVERALRLRGLDRELGRTRALLGAAERERGLLAGATRLLGESEAMRRLRSLIERVSASSGATVLVSGESGVGKDMVARAIHEASSRSAGPFFAVNCSQFTGTLLEAELFGHEKGAFTGAVRRRRGIIEMADTGTLFLDEIGDMPLEFQAALLRVLETRRFRRIGGEVEIAVDLRVIAATNQDLSNLIAAGRFRQDLYYRLNVFSIVAPPLRDHRDDVRALDEYFLGHCARLMNKSSVSATPKVWDALAAYDFPGNVRELKNIIERALILADENRTSVPEIDVIHLPAEVTRQKLVGYPVAEESFNLQEIEEERIAAAIKRTNGNLKEAARLLGIGYDSLRYKLRNHPPAD